MIFYIADALHPCEYGPCLYGGTCITLEEYTFECICTPGYEGEICDVSKYLTLCVFVQVLVINFQSR